jgi:hypothetical protein
MEKYYPPEYLKKEFHCIHCSVFSAQSWHNLKYRDTNGYFPDDADMLYSVCSHCKKWSYWYKGSMIVPSAAPVPPAHIDMPMSCNGDYNEARDIVSKSPKAATALLRLVLQKLMKELGENGKNINDDIKSLVAKGLPIQIQKALDICRVIGNNAVHPGEIEINDTPEIAHNLFSMINFIIEDRVSRPKQIDLLYEQLPEGAREAIIKRDNNI